MSQVVITRIEAILSLRVGLTSGFPFRSLDNKVCIRNHFISTGMIESPAETIDDIIAEVAAARVTERGSRADDKASEAAMEDRKKAGYF